MPIIAGRWGGEEFMLLVPDMVAEDAAATAEDLRREFSELAFDEGFSLTISFGVTEVSASDTMDTICSRVDKAMYASKDAGKDTVTVL
jgi:diguanylate cyclase (GGDEF)-like protein